MPQDYLFVKQMFDMKRNSIKKANGIAMPLAVFVSRLSGTGKPVPYS